MTTVVKDSQEEQPERAYFCMKGNMGPRGACNLEMPVIEKNEYSAFLVI